MRSFFNVSDCRSVADVLDDFEENALRSKDWLGKLVYDVDQGIVPPVKKDEGRKYYEILKSFPGVSKDDIDITLDKQKMKLEVKTSFDPKEDVLGREGEYTMFFRLPNADPKKIKSDLSDGILRITAEFDAGASTLTEIKID